MHGTKAVQPSGTVVFQPSFGLKCKRSDAGHMVYIDTELPFAENNKTFANESGFVSRKHHDIQRAISIDGDDFEVSQDGEGGGYALLYRNNPVAHIQELEREEPGSSVFEISTSEEYALPAVCILTAIHCVK